MKNQKTVRKEMRQPKGKAHLAEGAIRKRFEEGKEERLTGGSHPSGLKTPKELAGARRLRWPPALNHGEAE